ncbi:hypothetical protein AB6A40_008633 [Gnathostoma spinigerum]|uniref:Uncharacterized protein n=1 Tax=Gnathostoma spinigerum TaxID=75299 RepID=A0ABD6EUR5_9BILA
MELKIEAQTDSRDSFRSYIAGFEYSGSSNPSAGESPALSLLNGELVCCQCEDVTLYLPFRDSLFGNLYCTNFRICFTPAIELRKEPCCSRSLVFSDDLQLPLCSVERILYSSLSITTKNFASSGKFRLISCPLSQLDGVSAVKVFSKDFRSWTFDLQHSQLAVNFANHVLHFSRPRSPSNFFRVSFIASDPSLAGLNAIAFNNCCDWQKELSRCHVHFDQWRVCSLKALDQYYRNPVER